MAYYNYGYPQYFPQTQTPALNQTPIASQAPVSTQGGIIWVQGEAGAKSYMVAPSTTVQLWDSESQTIYLKSADASGMPSMRVLDYTIRDGGSGQGRAPGSASDYVTQDDLRALERKLNDRLDEIMRGDANAKSTL